MATLEELWPGVEAAAPNNPGPLLVCADKCDEIDKSELAYALRWCAGHQRRPYLAKKVYGGGHLNGWQWVRNYKTNAYFVSRDIKERKHALLSPFIFKAGKYDQAWIGWVKSLRTYEWLAFALAELRSIIEVPDIVLPPQPAIVRPGTVMCAGCGIMRDRSKLDCPVCKSSEVK